ncbi:MAG: M23 family metallopeptidase [Clostridiales Family XIII bacterium]|uniref:M23 family metallopeptidase n=1 Tax=Hominibacterium faecale TaxID=2839743 RepID=A0A9J6QTW6_9FIRM|nr:M23 family metallopeptidase [Hominibacterium faecale]MCU7378119.1 M23 family metallopeptidase [Hominibacterium faecale]MDY3011428.1 M23 family metallopeptidase [Clostridiales Family XIII bacterium]
MAKKKKKKTKVKVKTKKAKKTTSKNTASWGGRAFRITTQKIMALESMSITDSYTADGDSPGRDKTRFNIPVTLMSGIGYDVQTEIAAWRNLIGKSNYFYLKGKKFFTQKFVLVSVNTSDIKFTAKGTPVTAKVTLDFEEYRKPSKKATSAKATTTASTKSSGGNTSSNFTWPVPGHKRISSEYGWRNCPYHGREKHSGIDVPAPSGTPIVAAQGGKIIMAGRNGSYGNCIIINHGNGVYSLYGHCSSLIAGNGSNVKKGQKIAKVGSTGNSTGPHCHFEVRKGANKHSNNVNPHPYLK